MHDQLAKDTGSAREERPDVEPSTHCNTLYTNIYIYIEREREYMYIDWVCASSVPRSYMRTVVVYNKN
jgi:hypothetical protein